jgi:hypothetical protein
MVAFDSCHNLNSIIYQGQSRKEILYLKLSGSGRNICDSTTLPQGCGPAYDPYSWSCRIPIRFQCCGSEAFLTPGSGIRDG